MVLQVFQVLQVLQVPQDLQVLQGVQHFFQHSSSSRFNKEVVYISLFKWVLLVLSTGSTWVFDKV